MVFSYRGERGTRYCIRTDSRTKGYGITSTGLWPEKLNMIVWFEYRIFISITNSILEWLFLTLMTGIYAKFEIRRNVVHVLPWRVRQSIPEVYHLWHITGRQCQIIKKVASSVHFITILYILDKNEKNNQSPHWGRVKGIPSSCPDLQYKLLSKPDCELQISDTQMLFLFPSLNVVTDSINLF